MSPHSTSTATRSRHAWHGAAAVAAAALLPGPGAATHIPSTAQSLPHSHQQPVAADAVLSTSGPQRTLARAYNPDYNYNYNYDYYPPVDYHYDYSYPGSKGYDYSWRDYADLNPAEQAEAECTVVAATEEVTVAGCGDLHASAVLELFETVCSNPDSVSLEKIEEVFLQRDAVAFAQATAAAIVDCTSTNEDAFLCASVTATAQAFAETTVTAHVEAMATVVRGCGCQDDITAFGSSEVFISLVAQATATATASACIQGSGRVVSTAYSSCTSVVFARVFALAAAQAIIEGSCLNGETAAALLLEADAMDITAGSTCGGLTAVTVNGEPAGQ